MDDPVEGTAEQFRELRGFNIHALYPLAKVMRLGIPIYVLRLHYFYLLNTPIFYRVTCLFMHYQKGYETKDYQRRRTGRVALRHVPLGCLQALCRFVSKLYAACLSAATTEV